MGWQAPPYQPHVFLSCRHPPRSCASLQYHVVMLGSGDFVGQNCHHRTICVGSDSSPCPYFHDQKVGRQLSHTSTSSRFLHHPAQGRRSHPTRSVSSYGSGKRDESVLLCTATRSYIFPRLQLPLGFGHEHRIKSKGPSLNDGCGQLAFGIRY
jgi:hypothetical protein